MAIWGGQYSTCATIETTINQEIITADCASQALLPGAGDVGPLRRRKMEATQRLLGDTIGMTDLAWQEPSRLPGWTRAHVATHLARNADALSRVVEGALSGNPTRLYSSEQERQRDIERGSERTPLELQIDLDTSAGRLSHNFDEITPDNEPMQVELAAGKWVRLDLLPLARLSEVVLHHTDLDCGFELFDVTAEIASWLLAWRCYWVADRPDVPAIDLQSDSGLHARLGVPGEATEVHGADALLVGWLTGRLSQDAQCDLGLPLLPSLS